MVFSDDEEEETILKYLVALGDRGFPLNHRRLKELVDVILRRPDHYGPEFKGVGIRWTERFVQRHSDRIGMYWSSGLDTKRGRAVNPTANAKWQELLRQLLEDFNLQAEDIYGTDETGFMTGVGLKERVIGRRGKKVQHQQRGGNRETITVIPTICADGTSIPPAVIFKGKSYQVRWKQNNPLHASYVFYSL